LRGWNPASMSCSFTMNNFHIYEAIGHNKHSVSDPSLAMHPPAPKGFGYAFPSPLPWIRWDRDVLSSSACDF
jgi:hypothetical protein